MKKDPIPPQPLEEEIVRFNLDQPPLSLVASNTSAYDRPTSDNRQYAGIRKIPGWFKKLGQAELQSYGVMVPTFIWDQREIMPWDCLMLEVLVKHWLDAKGQGAFFNYVLEEEYCTSEIIHGVAERWLRGQKEEKRKPKIQSKTTKPKVRQQVSQECFFLSTELY